MKTILVIFASFLLAGELEVDGNLKVTGTVDANGNPITNVGTPLLSTDAANAGYVLNASAGKGRIITLKCPWADLDGSSDFFLTCEPPSCPNGWNELAISNELVSMTYNPGNHYFGGNSIRYCIEQEETK